LGNLLELSGFDYNSSEDVRAEVLGATAPAFASGLDNGVNGVDLTLSATVANAVANGLQRVADVPIHFADALARRSPALQKTKDSSAPVARVNPATLAALGLTNGQRVRVGSRVGAGETAVAELDVAEDKGIPAGCIRVAAAHAATVAVGALTSTLTVEKL
jgi:NADH-quinone oxidoreductase subunit G